MLKVRPGASPAGEVEDPRVRRTRQRFLLRQRARRMVVWRRLLAVLAVVALVVGAGWLVYFSPVLAVHQVEVRGTAVLDVAEVERAAAVPMDVPLATSDLDAVEARVEDLAPVASVEAYRSWPDTLVVEVTERTPVAAVDFEGTWRGLDAEGVLFRSYDEEPDGLTRITMDAGTSAEALAEAATVLGALPEDLLARLDHLSVTSVDAISLFLDGGATVAWGSSEQSADKVRVLELLLAEKAAAYDVSAPGRPTLRR